MSAKQVKSNVTHRVLELASDFISLFYPNYCLGCSVALYKGEEILCTRCIRELPRTGYIQHHNNPIFLRLAGRLPIRMATAFLTFRKTGITQHLLHQLKYNNHPEVGIRLGKLMGKELRDAGYGNRLDLIVPVPLHESRRRKRGYNQSAKIAEGICSVMEVPWSESISSRIVSTTTQTRKTRVERWENVKDAFRVNQPDQIAGKRILLLDDVMTTGATLEACGQHLIESGCLELNVACLAEAQ